MLIRATDTPSSEPLRATVCVVGSGPSGLTLTRRLVESGIHVLVLEAGPLNRGRPATDSLPLPVECVGQPKNLAPTIAQQVGGTSALWRGALGPLDAIDFRRRPWIPDSGWPVDAEDLASFYSEAASFFRVADPALFDVRALPAPLEALLEEMPFDRTLLENKLFQQPMPPKRFVDDALGYVDRCRHAHLVHGARVIELLTSDNGAVVSRVLYLASDGSRRTVEAEHVVLCGGAYQNPRLLLNSRASWANGIGNHNGLVGRYLADHPMGNLFQVRLRRPMKAHIYADLMVRPGQRLRSALRLTDARQEAQGLPNHAFYLRPSFAEGIDDRKENVRRRLLALRGGRISPADLWYVATSVDLITQILAYRFALKASYEIAYVMFVCEQIPNPASRVTLSDSLGPDGYPIARADWRLRERDFESVGAMYDLLVGGGLDPGFFRPIHHRDDLAWREQLSSAAHHLGTCRMAQGPSSGVVDRDLKVFGTENLYVCDGSVFPTTGNANSTLTAAALALRLGAHLGGRIERAGPATPRSTAPRPVVALTGASGFIGRNFVAGYAGEVAELRALGRSASSLPRTGNVSAHAWPLDDPAALACSLEGCDTLVHLAYQHGNAAWNLAALRGLVAAAHQAGVRRIVHVSTISVYNQAHVGVLIEQDDRARTTDEYSVVKRRLEAEFATLVARYGLRGLVLQPTIVYGWAGNWTGNAADVAKHERAVLPEAGRGLCNAVHVDDVAAAIFLAAASPDAVLAEEGEAPCFLISGPEPVTWAQFYSEHAAMLRRLGLPEQLRIEALTSSRPYHNDWKRNLIYRSLYDGSAGRLAPPLIRLARRALRREGGAPNRTRAALARLSAPLREGAWVATGLGRASLRARYQVDSGRARRVLGYRPKRDLADGIAATEEAIRRAMTTSRDGEDC